MLDAFWTAPTTNVDGSPLTDLASYRVYYGTSSVPCPGSSFFQVASLTPSPPPNQTVTFRLMGLSTGTLYNVSVTAADMSGNESACSTTASAAARIDYSVSPITIVNFGNVNIGSFADQVFTVTNIGGGIVSGTVSTSTPFSIVSGSPFTLVGLSATQLVRVRFTPAGPVTASANVNFAADGDALSRLVTGVGLSTDIMPPTVTITSPTTGSTYSTTDQLLTLAGTASDNVGVTQVTWANNAGGGGLASGTTSWTATGIGLRLGPNVLTVTAADAAGNTASVALTVTLTSTFAFTDDPLVARSAPIKAIHITELRTAIDGVRAARQLSPFAWTDPTLAPGSTLVKAVHVRELLTALNQAYTAAGSSLPTYTDPTVVAGATVIKAIHLNELRAAVRALE